MGLGFLGESVSAMGGLSKSIKTLGGSIEEAKKEEEDDEEEDKLTF